MKYTYDYIIDDISEIKPVINKGGLFFPLKIETGILPPDADGLSFGYPVDEGAYSIVTFEPAVGVLAEDTIAMFKTYNDIKKSSAKPLHLMDYVDYPDWENTDEYKQWLKDYPNQMCDTCGGLCENYHHWHHERQIAHDNIYKISSEDFEQVNDEHIFANFSSKNYGVQVLYKLDNGKYIAYIQANRYADMNEYFYCVLNDSEEEILSIIKAKQEIIKQNNELHQKIGENIKLLSEIFGYKAA